MTSKKVVSTLAFLINAGISSTLYHDMSDQHKKLKGAKAYWDGDILCFKIQDKVYRLNVVKEE